MITQGSQVVCQVLYDGIPYGKPFIGIVVGESRDKQCWYVKSGEAKERYWKPYCTEYIDTKGE